MKTNLKKKVSLLKTLKKWSIHNLYFYFDWELYGYAEIKEPLPVDRHVIDILFDIMRDSLKHVPEDLEVLKTSEDFSNWFDAIRLWVTSDEDLQNVFASFDCYRSPLKASELENYKKIMASNSEENE